MTSANPTNGYVNESETVAAPTNGHTNGDAPHGAVPKATKPVQNGQNDLFSIFPKQRLELYRGDWVVLPIEQGKEGGLTKFACREAGLFQKTILLRPAGHWLTIGRLALVEITEDHDRFLFAEVRSLVDVTLDPASEKEGGPLSLATAWQRVKDHFSAELPPLTKLIDEFVSGVPLSMAELVTPWVEWPARPNLVGNEVVFEIPKADFGKFLGRNHEVLIRMANAFAWLGLRVRAADTEALNAKRTADEAAYDRVFPGKKVWFPNLMIAQQLLEAFLKEEAERKEAARKAAQRQAELEEEALKRGTTQRYKGRGSARGRATQAS